MAGQPRVSIGMPVFNGENYLSQALDSLLAQKFDNFEIIISDNASTDRTYAICQEYLRIDKRIKYYKNETNMGGAYNDNHVFHLSSGEYFRWAAHDDICAPDLLGKCVEILDRDPSVVLSYPKTIIIDENGQIVEYYQDTLNIVSLTPHERFRQVLDQKRLLNAIYGLMRSDAVRKTKIIQKFISSDRIFLGELALQGKFFEVPEYLFYRRVHPHKSTVINKTTEQMTQWYNPMALGKFQVPKAQRFIGNFSAFQRANLDSAEKFACLVEFLGFYFSPRTFIGRFNGLIAEFIQAERGVVTRLTHKS